MIKIFRKVRQKLLSENKFSRYFIYAIGEILLVVVGILIALQINNRNEARKDAKTINQFLLTISKNMAEDSLMATSHLSRREKIVEANKKATLMYLTNEFDVETLKEAERYFYEFYFKPNKSGFEALKSSGFYGKINHPKVDSLLNRYYAIVDDIQEKEISYNTFIENIEFKFRTEQSSSEYYAALIPDFYQLDTTYHIDPKKLLDYYKTTTFEAGVSRTAVVHLGDYKELIRTARNFIDEVKKRQVKG